LEGEEVLLQCRFPPVPADQPVTLYWIRNNRVGSDNAAIEAVSLEASYRVERLPSMGRYDLSIRNTTYDRDNGSFKCMLMEGGTGRMLFTKEVGLTVLLKPSAPRISPSSPIAIVNLTDTAERSESEEDVETRRNETTRQPDIADLHSKMESCCPHSRRILMVGESGVGKSTLGNRLLGKKNGTCSSMVDNKGEPILEFGVGFGFGSETSSTNWIAGNWLGSGGSCITIIDTPGVGDTGGADCTNAMQTATFVKSLNSIHAFVLVLKGTTTRIGPELQNHINHFVEMFGQDFWRKVVIEVTFWSHTNDDKAQRKRTREMDEETLERALNGLMASVFKTNVTIPIAFVDPVYSPDTAEPEEHVAYERETDKLWSFIDRGDSFICGDFCEAPDSLAGIPTLVDQRRILKRAGTSVAISWTIFFASCDDTAIKSYHLLKDGREVFRMDDESGSSQKYPARLDGFPQNARIVDHCSTNEGEACSSDQSQMKVIRLQFSSIAEDGFGEYSIRNGKGSSANVIIEQIFDGTQSEWSKFSPCTVTCLPLDGTWGSMMRTRRCIPPRKGGLPCNGKQEDVRQCAIPADDPWDAPPRPCEGTPGEWGMWSQCSRSCASGIQKRIRDCEGGMVCPALQTTEIKSCNEHDCPVEAEYSEWGGWKCKESCYIPGLEKMKTTEYRNRTCLEGNPRHPTYNCDILKDLGEEQPECSTAPPCPPMTKIIVNVCPDDGTKENVHLAFQTCDSNAGTTDDMDDCKKKRKWCETIKLSSTFKAGAKLEFFQHEFGNCNTKNIRSVDELWVMAVQSITMTKDFFHLCKVTVEFGDRSDPNHSRWDWVGDKIQTRPDQTRPDLAFLLEGETYHLGSKGQSLWLQTSRS
jgi:hypothetical protein